MLIKQLLIKDNVIKYYLTYKKVKNINLRIKANGDIFVSANVNVPQRVIDGFILSKSDAILEVLKKYEKESKKPPEQYFSEDEIRSVILKLCKKAYPYFEKRDIKYPQIKFRKMVSRWGSCHSAKGILTFNTNLMYAPIECVKYVVLHEFTHFLQANHSDKFYDELVKVCPDWKVCRKRLKEINIR